MPDHQLPGQQSRPAQGAEQPQPYPPQGLYPPQGQFMQPGRFAQPGWYGPPQPPPNYAAGGKPPRSRAEKPVLVGGSVATFVLGCYSTLVAFVLFINMGMSQGTSYPPGVYEKYVLILVLLFPGPLVALIIAWAGYGVLHKHPTASLSWFTVFITGWLLVFLLWLGPEMAFPMTGSLFS